MIFIDEIDAIAPKREEVTGEVERRVVSQLLCLHPSTTVYKDGSPLTIKELFETTEGKEIEDEFGVVHKLPNEDVYVLGMDENGKVGKIKVVALSKTKVKNPIRIKLSTGEEIIASKITKVLRIGNEGIEWVNVNEIKEGDYIIAPSNIHIPFKIHQIDIKTFKNSERWVARVEEGSLPFFVFGRKYIRLSELKDLELHKLEIKRLKKLTQKIVYLLSIRDKATKEELEFLLKVSRRALNIALRRLKKTGVIEIDKNVVNLKIPKSYNILKLAYKSDGKIYPIKEKYFIELPNHLDEDFAKLLGYVISEGHLYNHALNISGGVANDATLLIEKIFKIKPVKKRTHVEMVYAYSKPLVRFLNEYFGIPIGKKSNKVEIPKQIFSSPQAVKAAFLAGLLEGDGHVGDTQIRFFTSSKKLAKGIATLLYSLGIPAKVKRYNLYVVQPFGGYQTFKRFYQTVGPFISDEKKKSKLEKLLIRKKTVSSIVWPVKEALHRLRKMHNIRLEDDKYRYLSPNVNLHINSNVLGYFIQSLESLQNVFVRELRRFSASDVIPIKIEEVEILDEEIEMYDLTTETSNFIVGNLPLIVHNTLMDGLKSRGKVIVIAATNRPNAIDPALRRPGRFDREIEIGIPDKKGRKEIFQIHARRMPKRPPYSKDFVIRALKELKREYEKTDKEKAKEVEKALEKMKEVHDEEEKIKEIVDSLPREISSKVEDKLIDYMFDKLAEITYGYTGADIAAVCREAAMHAIRRVLPEIKKYEEGEEIPREVLEKLEVTMKDFMHALRIVEPSAMREVLIEVPNVRWDDVGDLEDVKQQLKEAVEWPLKYPESFKRLGIKPPKGILLYGPPGCGKTLLAKAVATESEANFISVKGPELLSKWYGESEKRIRELFRRARQVAPCIIFFDEIDAMAPKRGFGMHEVSERIVSQLLTEMSGIEELKDVVVIAATNRPDILDPALLRPGRFDRLIYVPAPNEEARYKILKVLTRNMPLSKDINLKKLAKMTEGFTGADLEALCREAAMNAIRENKKAKEVKMKHFEKALEIITPSVSKELIKFYEKFAERFKRRVITETKREKEEDEFSYVG
ncbi:MAG: AAA family ATPase [Candidatus Aenigmarchaeota archaeon]|nr:AAA family ATPase [Candidatus Aenigmarchaeota archaeon]